MATVAILISDAEDNAVDINVRSDSAFSVDADPSHFTPAEGTAVMLLQTLKLMQTLEGVVEPSEEAVSED